MTTEHSSQLESAIAKLDPAAVDCRSQIAALRREMDALCDRGAIGIQVWRKMLESISAVQALIATRTGNA